MDSKINKRIKSLEENDVKIEQRLAGIEKLLTNHVFHQKIMIDRWIKIILPLVSVLVPVLVALVQNPEFFPSVLRLFLPHTGK